MSLITETISIGCSSFLTTCSGHSISAYWSLKSLLLRPLSPSCIARKTRLWRSPSKPSTSSEVRNTLIQGIFGSSLTYISHDWPSLKPRALHTLSTLFRTAFRSIFSTTSSRYYNQESSLSIIRHECCLWLGCWIAQPWQQFSFSSWICSSTILA